MGIPGRTGQFLGLDIGRVNTRVSVFGITGGKYRLQASKTARTDFGFDGHLAAGVHQALAQLQQDLDLKFIHLPGSRIEKAAINHQVVSQAGLSLSFFPEVRAALFGVTAEGSLAAGMGLAGKLPVRLVGSFGSAHLADEPAVIDSLIASRPEILILTGGEDSGAEAPLQRWIEIARLICRVLPEEVSPTVFFAGNQKLDPVVRRRLEPISRLVMLPNLQPVVGERDDVPSHAAISRHIISLSLSKLSGLQGLTQLAGDLFGSRMFALDRMVRYLSRSEGHQPKAAKSVLAIDIGAGSTAVCLGKGGQTSGFRQNNAENGLGEWLESASGWIHQWAAAPVDLADVAIYLSDCHLLPSKIPQTLRDLAVSQSLARYQIRAALRGMFERDARLPFDAEHGLVGQVGMVIASGSVLTNAPTPGQAMLMLLDGLQPWRETTLVLDRYHLLPLLGLLGEVEPLLPVHLLDSNAFANLGTVIPVISDVPEGMLALSVHVSMHSGKAYDIDVPGGALRRLVVSPGESVTLDLNPISDADVGKGPGVARQLSLKGGMLGVVIDARGRPLNLPLDEEERLERLRHWLWALGG